MGQLRQGPDPRSPPARIAPHLPAMLVWVQDLTWPGGAKAILQHLNTLPTSMTAAPIAQARAMAQDSGDDQWLDSLDLLA